MINVEQHPPASSNARRARDERFGTKFSPLSDLPDLRATSRASTLYGSASIFVM
jgi:hypothetical protein